MSWLFPAYFIGLLGLALPWILHRFSDQSPPEQLFPSKRFLEPTTPPVSRKRTLRYRALLALRVLSLLLLCVLFAQPWLNKAGLTGNEQQHHLIAIDQSLSMKAEGRWAAAMEQARQVLDQVDNGSVQLIGFDQRITVIASSDSADPTGSVSPAVALDDLQPTHSPADYGVLMQGLDRIASEQELPVKLWLISDLQHSALPSQLNALYAPAIDALELVPVVGDDALNVHLYAEAQSSNGATASLSVSLLASSANDMPASSLERTVRVETSERVLEQRTVSLRTGELTVLNFDELTLAAKANPQLIVSLLESDALAEDNVQRLPVVEPQPTGIVLLNSPGTIEGNAPVFITTALETDGLSSVESIRGTALQVPPDTPHVVTGRALNAPMELDILQYVDTGNNALVYNTAVATRDAPVRFDGSVVGTMDDAHPLALGEIDWFGTRFYELPELQLEDSDRVLLSTSEGDSVLVERATNRGRLLILNDPLDGLASNLPLQPAFVALTQSLIRYFDASTSVPDTVVIGERLALPPNVQLIDPQGEPVLGLGESSRSSTVELTEPGVYTVVSTRGEQTLRAVLDANEADLSMLNDDDINAWQARYDAAARRDDVAGSAMENPVSEPRSVLRGNDTMRYSLWPWLLPMLVVLLLTESWYANRRLDVRRDGS